MSELLTNLNEEQLAAVTLPNQSALILAGAGSGKTRVLTTRIAWLLQQGMASPGGILAVTFTNKAAKEMMTRLSAMVPISIRGMWMGTFHGLCNRFLRAHYRDAALPQTFQILDTQDQLSAIKRLLKALNVDDEKFPAKNLMWFINAAKEQGQRAAEMEAHDDHSRKQIALYAAYEDQCQREGVVDFAELLLRSYELLKRNQPLREHYQNRFRHILVDEFQDTNKLQYAWLKLLAGKHHCVFAVGDDDQSIYAFRGANVGNMADFEREFQIQDLIKLEQNYRSQGNILDAANELIGHNSRRLGKNLRTDAGHGEPIRIYEAATDGQEATWLVEEIKGLIAQGYKRDEIAILYRSNAQSRIIEHGLFSAMIAYRVYGGLRFFERAEVKHALAYLRLMENPNDDTAFARVVNFPTRGIGARSLEQLQDVAKTNHCSMYAAAPYLSGKAGSSIGAFVKLVESARFETQAMSLSEVVDYIIKASGLITHYQNDKEGQDRIDNLFELVNAAKAFVTEEGLGLDARANTIPAPRAECQNLTDSQTGDTLMTDLSANEVMSPLAAFLSHASLEAGDNQAQAGQDAIQLMTVHAAKGLEFKAVFITGLEEGLFPHENSLTEMDGIEEERRLMYVAITRARERLYISTTQSRMLHGQTRYNVKSRFLDELPEHALKWLVPKIQARSNWETQEPAWGKDWFTRPAALNGMSAKKAGNDINGVAYKVGQKVFHNKFGEGTIINLEGAGTDARAQINFGRHGAKWLALGVAKLEVI